MKRPLPHHRSRNAFTVIEMLVVIGILVVVSLGVATIFQSVGETVARGRKLSELNQFASRMERVMREDFQRMTRDGFLVIINKNAGFQPSSGQVEDTLLYRGQDTDQDGNGVPGRIRRSDEIMFFARGDYVSQRRPIAPNMIASSNEAAIYYGHGQKRRPQIAQGDPAFDNPSNLFFNPQPWDNNFDPTLDTRLGVRTPGFVNPNEFARDWSLLRVVTLLTNPQGAGQTVPRELFNYRSNDLSAAWQREALTDSDRQIALQPAARSIFKSLNGSSRIDPAVGGLINRSVYDDVYRGQPSSPSDYPLYLPTSGMVDVVTQDLASIRTELQALATFQYPSFYMDYNQAYGNLPTPAPPGGVGTRDAFELDFYSTPATPPRPIDAQSLDLGKYDTSGRWVAPNATQAQRIRSWMIDALPSAWNTGANNDGTVNPGDFYGGVRYEDIPTRLLFNENDFPTNEIGGLQRAYAEANQEMLGSSIFVPRCTEFIVEWSYGFVDHTFDGSPGDSRFKKIQWYGLPRATYDTNGDGFVGFNDLNEIDVYQPRMSSGEAGQFPGTTISREFGGDDALITGRTAALSGASNIVEAACFGFATQPGSTTSPEGAEWPWPKLVRITMTLGDPNDRDVEETYQIILEIPEPE